MEQHKEKQPREHGRDNHTRRTFLTKVWIGLGAIASLEIIGVVLAFLRPRKVSPGEGTFGGVIAAGSVGDFEPNSVTANVRGHFYLACLEDGGFLALSRKCSHLGCTVIWDTERKEFLCPCHASAFNMRGNVVSSPASRPLDIFPITIENEIVNVDTRKPIRRGQFQVEQVTYPYELEDDSG